MTRDEHDAKMDDIVTGKEDLKIGVLTKYERVLHNSIDEDNKPYIYSTDEEVKYYYLTFRTLAKLKYKYDGELADFFDLALDEYKEILAEFGNYNFEEDRTLFKTKRSVKLALDALAPYIVKNKLIKNNKVTNLDKLPDPPRFSYENQDDDFWNERFDIYQEEQEQLRKNGYDVDIL